VVIYVSYTAGVGSAGFGRLNLWRGIEKMAGSG
jgi:hypothetical protein